MTPNDQAVLGFDHMADSNNMPAHSVRRGNIKLAIWKKAGEHGELYTTQVERIYKDKEGEWKHTPYLNSGDLGNLVLAASAADSWIDSQRIEK